VETDAGTADQYMTTEGDLALLNEDGNPLQKKFVDDNGKPQKVCNISSAYARLRKNLKLPPMDNFGNARRT